MSSSVEHLAIDIGATKTLVGIFNDAGELTNQHKFSTMRNKAEFEDALFAASDTLLNQRQPDSIGLGVAGLVNGDHTFTSATIGWQNYNLSETLSARYGCNTSIDNDVNRAGLAEARSGAAAGFASVLYVSISTNIGTSLMLDGKILKSLSVSEGGLMLTDVTPDKKTSSMRVQDLLSGTGFKKVFGAGPEETVDQGSWDIYGRYLGRSLFNMSAMFFPEAIVLGGGVANQYTRFGSVMLAEYVELFPDNCPLPQIRQAQFINDGVLHGCYEATKV